MAVNDWCLNPTPEQIADMLSMIDGAYEVVELHGFNSESPSVKQWSKDWLEKARGFGATTW